MPTVNITCQLPYHLRVADETYGAQGNEPVTLYTQDVGGRQFTSAMLSVDIDGQLDDAAKEKIVGQTAKKLVSRVNRLIRWYRLLVQIPTMLEVTLSTASPFSLIEAQSGRLWWTKKFEFAPDPPPPPNFFKQSELTSQIQALYQSRQEPDVSEQNVADAKQALRVGRFREAVLLAWSAIDSVFSSYYDNRVSEVFPKETELSSAIDFLTGHTFGLKNKMTVMLFLLSGRSFYRESDGFWDRLSSSYTTRNNIIHSGHTASEDDARKAIEVAQRTVEMIEELKQKDT